jgi:hypothetical protein
MLPPGELQILLQVLNNQRRLGELHLALLHLTRSLLSLKVIILNLQPLHFQFQAGVLFQILVKLLLGGLDIGFVFGDFGLEVDLAEQLADDVVDGGVVVDIGGLRGVDLVLQVWHYRAAFRFGCLGIEDLF